VWVLFAHVWRGEGVDEEYLHRFLLDRRGRCLEELRTQEAALYLYDLTAEPDEPGRAAPSRSRYALPFAAPAEMPAEVPAGPSGSRSSR
jgi:hypothetical protein